MYWILNGFLLLFPVHVLQAQSILQFKTDTSQLTLWNGTSYESFFIKGVNLGIAKPGTFPGELKATGADYLRWFGQIKDAGFNCIRLYTLHFPVFYESLRTYNAAHPQNPLLFIQGVWLEEHAPGYTDDLYELTGLFKNEIRENMYALNGAVSIPQRVGKAHGSYNADVSEWCLAYILGREIHPYEAVKTNANHPFDTVFEGSRFRLSQVHASECWLTSMLEYTVQLEDSVFHESRPVSVSSWPSLDPLQHPEELNDYEDMVSVDFSGMELVNVPAGFFISYHAYPYYPDFISKQSNYQQASDDEGPNSYLAYLTELKSHYRKFPLIIAEFGVPSSWVIAHYATSGMNHGGFNETDQGHTDIRMLKTIRQSGCGGGILFAWMDEWFKRTWVSDPLDYHAESRKQWHNLSSAEQNYGMLKFEKHTVFETLNQWDTGSAITSLAAGINFAFFETKIGLKKPLNIPDELWIAFDTYAPGLGELLMPSGDSIPSRCEFLLHVKNYAAQLYVTQAYDHFGRWHKVSDSSQVYRSIPTEGKPWNILRIRNNSGQSEVQYIGNLSVKPSFQPITSTDAIIVSDTGIHIRLPWNYLHVVGPDSMRVLHDNKSTTDLTEDTVTEGIRIHVKYQGKWHSHTQPFAWEGWSGDSVQYNETLKSSYHVMKDNLHKFNTPAIAIRDTYTFTTVPCIVSATEGLLKNDFDLDGNNLQCVLEQQPRNGFIELQEDGSFAFYPHKTGQVSDTFVYRLFDGYTLSGPATVALSYPEWTLVHETNKPHTAITLYPNPVTHTLQISGEKPIVSLRLFGMQGNQITTWNPGTNQVTLDVNGIPNGMYIMVIESGNLLTSHPFIKK